MTLAKTLPAQAILIVEDKASVRHDLMDFFEDRGLRVFEAENADEAIEVLAASPKIRIVLTDVQMPGPMDGLKLAHYIRDRYPPTLLVVVLGVIRPKPAAFPDRALSVTKPFDPRSVLREIKRRGA